MVLLLIIKKEKDHPNGRSVSPVGVVYADNVVTDVSTL